MGVARDRAAGRKTVVAAGALRASYLRLLRLLIYTCALAGALAAQSFTPELPKIDVLDFYGLNKVPQAKIRQALGAKEGDPLPASKGDAEERLAAVPGVIEAHLEAVCCDQGKTVLYVGIEERGALHFDLHDSPEGEMELPAVIVSTYRDFLDAFKNAAARGTTAEDLTKGYSLMADPLGREIQEKFPALANEHIAELRDVLKNSFDDEQRAIAAYVIGYASRKQDVIVDLQNALRDADPDVRANAVQALIALSVYARLHPEERIGIQPTWFIEMLNSLSWSDREHALRALQILTDTRDPSVISQLRDRGLASLIEMARWKTLAHALPAFVLVGRVAGWSDAQVQEAWNRGDREPAIAAATARRKK